MKSFTTTFSLYVQPTDIIILAVSGGIDSMVLLDVVLQHHPKDKIIVAHFDHSLRGAESDGDRELVEHIAQERGLAYEYAKKDIGAIAKAEKSSLEAVARRERYYFLESVRANHHARYILTAHHGDDQAETILLNMLKGGKTRGLSGMSVVSGYILRPLLSLSKSQIQIYAAEHGIEYREDSSNQDTDYDRNKIRQEVLPLLNELNPSLQETLGELGRYMQELSTYMTGQAESWLYTRSQESGKPKCFTILVFASESGFFQREILSYLYRRAHDGSTHGLSRGLLDELRRFILEGSNSHGKKEVRALRLERRGERIFY